MTQEEKQYLQKNLSDYTTQENYYQFGRIMPFGKYKGWYIYYMILKHPGYAKWVNDNTNFKFNETETWWLNEIFDLVRLDNLIGALGIAVVKYGALPENIENPHLIIE